MNPEIIVTLRGRRFKIVATKHADGYTWTAHRETGQDWWEKIPCMSRAEEAAFPHDVAWCATAFVAGLNYQQTKQEVA